MPAQSTPALDSHEAVVALADLGAHIVLCAGSKRPCWEGRIYPWTRKRPSAEVIADHDGLFGIVPWSIHSTALDVDSGDPSALVLKHPPYADLPTRRPGGHHLYYADTEARGNSSWAGWGCRGDVRGASGYAILWNDAPLRLLDALRDRVSRCKRFPIDLFDAAGMGALRPAEGIKHRPGGRLRVELVQPVYMATQGYRNASLFAHVVALADITNRPRHGDGTIDVRKWIEAVKVQALDAYRQMPRPRLDRDEAIQIAYHVATWTGSGHPMRDHSPDTQRRRAMRSASVRSASSLDRAREIVALLDQGYTMRSAAAAIGVSVGTVHGARRRVFNVPVRCTSVLGGIPTPEPDLFTPHSEASGVVDAVGARRRAASS